MKRQIVSNEEEFNGPSDHIPISKSEQKLSSQELFLIWLSSIIFPQIISILLFWTIKNRSIEIEIEENQWITLLLELIYGLVIIFIIGYVFHKKNLNTCEELGLTTQKKDNIKNLLIGLGFGLFFIIARELFDFYVRFISINREPTNLFLILTYSFLIALITSVYNEVLFRGFFQNHISTKLHPILTIILVAFMASVGNISYDSYWQIISTFTSAILYGYLYSISKNLYLSIGWHFAYVFIPTFGFLFFNYTPFNANYVEMVLNAANALVILGLLCYSFVKFRNIKLE